MSIYILIKHIASSFILVLLLGYFVVFKTYAQNTFSQTFTIGPPTIKTFLNPGESKQGNLSLINNSDNDLNFDVKVYALVVNDNQGTPKILSQESDINNPYSGRTWIKLFPDKLTLKAHKKSIIKYLINSPLDASPGGHYAAIVYQPFLTNVNYGNIAEIRTQIATLVYIEVNGQIRELAKITKFYSPSFLEYGPIKITSEIRNYGNIDINPKGKIVIQDIFGKVTYQSNLNDGNIYPGNVALDYHNIIGSPLMFGRYKATLSATYGLNNNLLLSPSIYIWIIPWKMLLISISMFIIISLLIVFLIMKKRKIPSPSLNINENEAKKIS